MTPAKQSRHSPGCAGYRLIALCRKLQFFDTYAGIQTLVSCRIERGYLEVPRTGMQVLDQESRDGWIVDRLDSVHRICRSSIVNLETGQIFQQAAVFVMSRRGPRQRCGTERLGNHFDTEATQTYAGLAIRYADPDSGPCTDITGIGRAGQTARR